MQESNRRWRDFYDGWAPRYDWGIGLGALLRGFSDTGERRKMVGRLNLRPDQRALEVSVGTGSNLSLMAEGVGDGGGLIGLDISRGMLRQCERKVGRRGLSADLIEGEAAHLPFPDNAFDAVLHFGGINEFDDKTRTVEEMTRVAKPGAKIVIADEGLDPNKPAPLRTRLLARVIPLYDHAPPTEPADARDVNVAWFRAGGCYLIDFVNP
jgi:ubiquinone/menaquinone biosynthesis C-methylase UbiE